VRLDYNRLNYINLGHLRKEGGQIARYNGYNDKMDR
jgi:hypothetical protein